MASNIGIKCLCCKSGDKNSYTKYINKNTYDTAWVCDDCACNKKVDKDFIEITKFKTK